MPEEKEPQLPGIDPTDPKVMAGLRRVATRRNNEVARRLPLFAPQIEKVTPEDILAQRIIYRAMTIENTAARHAQEAAQIEEWKAEVLARVGPEEFARLSRKLEARSYGSEWMGWLAMRDKVRGREVEEMPEAADLVFAWLQVWEGEPPTHHELHARCGDGLTVSEVAEGLHWLLNRELIEICIGRRCTVSAVPCCATWRVPPAEVTQ